ncbi:lysylphosphatidylglycerol synthase transmembrane domain-containing protein [Candidatus Magnetominusculus dajiuhuensis]|uniref:lysylphosphatidylglycerol synthase transmembrane domain-containing protein n=1 Tax=Candidatus Magnetominusculus dajiuhuensis TaxID=3137712 RepID=UPI003B42C8C1
MNKRIKKGLVSGLKVLVSGAILYVLLSKVDLNRVFSLLRNMDMLYFSLGCLLNVVTVGFISRRWQLFISDDIPLSKLFSLNMIGLFFNNIMPGTTGGDAVKVYYVYKKTGSGLIAAGSVFMDRYIGLANIIFIGLAAMMFGLNRLAGTGVEFFTPAVTLAFVVGSFIVFGFRLGGRFSSVAKFYEYFHLYMRDTKAIALSFMLTSAAQLIAIGCVYLVAVGLGVKIGVLDLLIFVPIIVLIAAIPISISGFGLREGAFVLLLKRAGIAEEMAIAISFGWYLTTLLASLPGFIFYLYNKTEVGGKADGEKTGDDDRVIESV